MPTYFTSSAEQGIHDGGEVAGDFFGRLPHVVFDPPVNGFDKSAGEMVTQKIARATAMILLNKSKILFSNERFLSFASGQVTKYFLQ